MRAHKRIHECSSSPPDSVALRAPGPACMRPRMHGRARERRRLSGKHAGPNCRRQSMQIDVIRLKSRRATNDGNAIALNSEPRHTFIFRNHIVIKNATC